MYALRCMDDQEAPRRMSKTPFAAHPATTAAKPGHRRLSPMSDKVKVNDTGSDMPP
jgi:hypothetical protein